MSVFWQGGYAGTSISDLVAATELTRETLYAEHAGKEALFEACIDHYRRAVVAPALQQLAPVARGGSSGAGVMRYFLFQIGKAEGFGLPGPGCLIANSAAEPVSQTPAVQAHVEAHVRQLSHAFADALARDAAPDTPQVIVREVARSLAIATQGFWTWSRSIDSARLLRREARNLVKLATARIEQ